jgi:hypothetical protein
VDFEGLLQLMSSNGIRFIVVGGVACALNGFVRATEDLDILVDSSGDNIKKLLNVLLGWGDGYAKELNVDDFPVSPGAIRVIEDFRHPSNLVYNFVKQRSKMAIQNIQYISFMGNKINNYLS